MEINTLHNTTTSKPIQEALLVAEVGVCPISGTRILPRLLLRLRVSELHDRPPIRCAPVTPHDRSQVEMAERRLFPSLAPVLALYLVKKLEAIRLLLLRILELWAPVIAYELDCRVGAVEEAVLLPV